MGRAHGDDDRRPHACGRGRANARALGDGHGCDHANARVNVPNGHDKRHELAGMALQSRPQSRPSLQAWSE